MMLDIPERYKLCSVDECRDLDDYTINDFGVPGYTLMEIAGSKTAALMLDEINYGSSGLFFCGKGNNAGDALVVARHLHRNGISSTIVFISGTENLSDDAETNYQLLKKLKQHSKSGTPEITFLEGWKSFLEQEVSIDFIVDGMLGTGLNSDVRGDYAKAIEWTNKQEQSVYAIDVPTGLHADSGVELGTAIKAKHTYTYGALKTGFYFNDGPALTGEVTLCDLGFPIYQSRDINNFLISTNWLDQQEKPIFHSRHKYDGGVLYIIAGSEGLTGAAMLAARSAWAEGLGAVFMIIPRGILPVFENNLLHQIKQPVGNHDDLWFKEEHVDDVLEILKNKKGKILLGPGLGRHESTVKFVDQLLAHDPGPMVIDADGLWCMSQLSAFPKHQNDWILTPHPGELQSLTDSGDSFKPYERLHLSKIFAIKNNLNIVSKGMPSIVSTPDGHSFVTNYDTTIFARAGFGDVLSGKIAAYFTLHYQPELSCITALIMGKNKFNYALHQKHHTYPEPADLI